MLRKLLVPLVLLIAGVTAGYLCWQRYYSWPALTRSALTPLPTRPPRPSGWAPPKWPPSQSSGVAFTPDFSITSWSFPNSTKVMEFYWQAPAHKQVVNHVGTTKELRALGRSCAASLTAACPDPAIASAVWRSYAVKNSLVVPVLLHRISLSGKQAWVLVLAWEEIIEGVPGSIGHIRILILRPGDAEIIDQLSCA
jgi:hypothetical protein